MRTKISAALLIVLVAIGIFIVYQNKGGRLIPLFICLFLLASACYYFAFINRDIALSYIPESGFYILIGLLILIALVIQYDQKGDEAIAKYVKPYPNIYEYAYLPILPDTVEHWLAYTEDDSKMVENFYQDEANLKGWSIKSGPPFLVLKKQNKKLLIAISSELDRTRIYYAVSTTK
jgi:hypothetical protein